MRGAFQARQQDVWPLAAPSRRVSVLAVVAFSGPFHGQSPRASAVIPAGVGTSVLFLLAALGLTFAALVVWEALQRVLRLRREAHAEHERAVFLAAAGEEFSHSLDLDTLVELVCRKAVHVMGDASVVHLTDEETSALRLACAYEKEPREGRNLQRLLEQRPEDHRQGLHHHIARTGEPLLVPDFPASSYAHPFDVETLGVRAALAVPLNVGDRVLGVLVVHYFDNRQQPTEADLRLAGLLADRAAIGLEHARLYRRMEELVEERTQELREAHQQILEAERAQAIAELAAMVAHEVRNPLHVVRTTTFALRERLHGQDVRTDRHLDALERNVDAAARIIQDLMDYGAFPEPELARVNFNEVACGAAAGIPHPDNVEITTEIAAEALPVCCDAAQVQRAVRSLVLNGVQAHDAAGKVTLRVVRQGSIAVAEVHDTGRGVPETDRPYLFKPLFSTKIKGAGLGLALARRILEANGGGLDYESTRGRTVFRAWLPLQPAELAGEPGSDAEAEVDEEAEGLRSSSVQAKERG